MATPISSDLATALVSSKQHPISKVEILDGITRTIIQTISSASIDEGTVTVDVGRGTRRTFQLRLSNKNGRWTPVSTTDNFYFNRLIRIYRGLRYINSAGVQTDEYVLLGTFMVDRPEVFVERNMSVLTIDGSDLWKKIASGGFTSGQSFPSGTHINTIISHVAVDAGISTQYLALSPYPTRTPDGYLTGTAITWEAGDNRSDFLINNLSTQWGIQIYFNPMGLLVSAEMPNVSLPSPVWTFSTGEDSIMLGVTKTLNDLKLINHVIVTGESSNGVSNEARYEIRDDDPSSPTYVGLIGDRLMLFSGPLITTHEQAVATAQKLYADNALIEEDLKLPVSVLPQLEGNDVISVVEPTFAKISTTYLAQRFDIPLRETRMTIESKKARAV